MLVLLLWPDSGAESHEPKRLQTSICLKVFVAEGSCGRKAWKSRINILECDWTSRHMISYHRCFKKKTNASSTHKQMPSCLGASALKSRQKHTKTDHEKNPMDSRLWTIPMLRIRSGNLASHSDLATGRVEGDFNST